MSSYWIAVLICAGIAVLNGVLMVAWAKRHIRQTYARLYPPTPEPAGVGRLPAKAPDQPADEPVTSA